MMNVKMAYKAYCMVFLIVVSFTGMDFGPTNYMICGGLSEFMLKVYKNFFKKKKEENGRDHSSYILVVVGHSMHNSYVS